MNSHPQARPFPPVYPDDAWELLAPKLSDERRKKMLDVVARRTQYIRLLIQDIVDPHNISACMRSADAFGILNVDIIAKHQKFSPSTAARGSGQWLQLKRWRSIEEAALAVKAQGFRIAAGYPKDGAYSVYDLPLDQPVAVLFGNEKHGLDDEWLKHADYAFTIPTTGMVESLNISVCAAISLLELTRRASAQVEKGRYYIPEEKQQKLLCEWICRYHSRHYELELDLLRKERHVAEPV
jgi:tRNA (guanosine-2'-O-)-methyltransferase